MYRARGNVDIYLEKKPGRRFDPAAPGVFVHAPEMPAKHALYLPRNLPVSKYST